tara:strand:+ start:6174 stop:6476 length:303 start_codon:yes stop_codon:yes gene_type:complete
MAVAGLRKQGYCLRPYQGLGSEPRVGEASQVVFDATSFYSILHISKAQSLLGPVHQAGVQYETFFLVVNTQNRGTSMLYVNPDFITNVVGLSFHPDYVRS